MNWAMGIRIALRALRVNKLRSTLTMLGIIIGVAAVITMIAVGSGAQARVEEQIRNLGTNLFILTPGSVTAGGVRMGAGTRSSLTEDDAYAVQREVSPVHAAAPALRGTGQVVAGGNNWSTVFFGVTQGREQIGLAGAGRAAALRDAAHRSLALHQYDGAPGGTFGQRVMAHLDAGHRRQAGLRRVDGCRWRLGDRGRHGRHDHGESEGERRNRRRERAGHCLLDACST
jgi:hypothetical protein